MVVLCVAALWTPLLLDVLLDGATWTWVLVQAGLAGVGSLLALTLLRADGHRRSRRRSPGR